MAKEIEDALNKIGVVGENKTFYLNLFNRQIEIRLSKYTDLVKNEIIRLAAEFLISSRNPNPKLITLAEVKYETRATGGFPTIKQEFSMKNRKDELIEEAEKRGIDTEGMTKAEILEQIQK
jgi:hypothetical protein